MEFEISYKGLGAVFQFLACIMIRVERFVIFKKLVFSITSTCRLLTILMDNIDSKNSSDFRLQIKSICSLRVLYRKMLNPDCNLTHR